MPRLLALKGTRFISILGPCSIPARATLALPNPRRLDLSIKRGATDGLAAWFHAGREDLPQLDQGPHDDGVDLDCAVSPENTWESIATPRSAKAHRK